MHCLGLLATGSFRLVYLLGVRRDGIGMISIRLVEFLGSGSWSVLSRPKRLGMPDMHLSKDS